MQSPPSEQTTARSIFINDVTLRDGEQAPGNTMTADQKITIARQLVRTGIPGIEAGFPIASPGEARSVEQIAGEVGTMQLPHATAHSAYPRISGLARLNEGDIRAVLAAVRPAPHRGVHTFISTSFEQIDKFDDMLKRAGGRPGNMSDFMDKIVMPGIETNFGIIREQDPHAIIQFSPEDWTRTDESVSDDVVLAAAANGASVINLPDTVGVGIPRIVGSRVAHVRKVLDANGFQHVKISWHGHNDTGQGVACAMEALYGGAEQFETTILGIGERTGNFSFEGFLAAVDANMRMHEEIIGMKIEDPLVRKEVMRTAQLVARMIGMQIPREHPIVGENAFAHASGIHQQGMMAAQRTGKRVYEALRPEDYGAVSKLILDKHSGWAAIQDFLRKHELPAHPRDRQAFMQALSTAADDRRKGLSDQEVVELVYYPTVVELTGGPVVRGIEPMEPENGHKRVSVKMRGADNADEQVIGVGTTPSEGVINAAVQALKQRMGTVDIVDFHVDMVPADETGSAAPAVATLTMKNGTEVTVHVRGTDTTVIELEAVQRAFNALCAREDYAKRIAEEAAS